VATFCLLAANLQAQLADMTAIPEKSETLPAIPEEYRGTFYLQEQIIERKVERMSPSKHFCEIEANQVLLDSGEKLQVAEVIKDFSLTLISFVNHKFVWVVVVSGSQFHITQEDLKAGGRSPLQRIFFVSRAKTVPGTKSTYSPSQIRELFFLLGMNNEYMGKCAGEANRFYSSEGPQNAVYEKHAESLRAGLELKSSAEVWPLVDSLYKRGGVGFGIGDAVYYISEDAFEGYGKQAVLGYLAGASVRDWHKGSYWFPNAGHKADLVAELLSRYGCKRVKVSRNYRSTPVSYEVRYRPSPIIKKLIEDAVAECDMPNQIVPAD